MMRPRPWTAAIAVCTLVAIGATGIAARDRRPQRASAPDTRPQTTASIADLAVQITSPLGRTGTAGTVRIVAQLHATGPLPSVRVSFSVDGTLVGTAENGPPYAVPWTDDNPFERHEISVLVEAADGRTAHASMTLEPYEIVEVTNVNSVLIEASVYDKRGRYVLDLDRSSFALTENGVPQTIDLVQQEFVPATFALLVDSSQSMSRRMPFVRDAAARVVSYMKPVDRVLVVPFGTKLKELTGPTADKETVRDAIGSIQATGGTAFLDALVATAKLLDGVSGRHAVVFITDGYDENSTTTGDEAIAALKSAGCTVYAIGIGGVAGLSLKGQRFLRDLAAATGGRAYFPPTEAALSDIYDALSADVQNRYLVTYTPRNQAADGQWRAVTLDAGGGQYVVRARDGYRAPRPAPIRPSFEFVVTDAHQAYTDVTRDDLIVREDGVEQKIETFQEALSQVSLVLALDASGSMKKSADGVQDAARRLVASLHPEDSLALLLFADQLAVAHALSLNRAWSMEAIDEYKADGGTALYDALYGSLQMLKKVQGRRAVLVVTDGMDEDRAGKLAGSVHTLDEVMDMARETDCAIFTVGIGSKVDRTVLSQLAAVSGGTACFPSDVTSLTDEYGRIMENLRRRFVLSYTSTHVQRDGLWRNVEIKSRRAGLVITARTGYLAPAR
jgi:Ca-activated chloride channel homolog